VVAFAATSTATDVQKTDSTGLAYNKHGCSRQYSAHSSSNNNVTQLLAQIRQTCNWNRQTV